MDEIWRDIKNYEGLYQVSNWGRVKSLVDNHGKFREKILSPGKHGKGYLAVNLCKGGEHKRYTVHRLVLMTFSPVANMSELLVNHKDEDKTNNNLNNLEWCTTLYNNTYNDKHKKIGEKLRGKPLSEATKRKLSEANTGKKLSDETKRKLSKPIVQLDASINKVINVWGSAMAAERECGFNNGNIIKCCKNKYIREGNNIYKGYKWQYLHVYMHNIDSRIKKVILFGKEYVF